MDPITSLHVTQAKNLKEILDIMPGHAQAAFRHVYRLGYLAKEAEVKRTLANAHWASNGANGNIIAEIQRGKSDYNGLPTYAIADIMKLDVSGGKYSANACNLREALKTAGYSQRLVRYRGKMVKGWFNYPPRCKADSIATTQPSYNSDEELPL